MTVIPRLGPMCRYNWFGQTRLDLNWRYGWGYHDDYMKPIRFADIFESVSNMMKGVGANYKQFCLARIKVVLDDFDIQGYYSRDVKTSANEMLVEKIMAEGKFRRGKATIQEERDFIKSQLDLGLLDAAVDPININPDPINPIDTVKVNTFWDLNGGPAPEWGKFNETENVKTHMLRRGKKLFFKFYCKPKKYLNVISATWPGIKNIVYTQNPEIPLPTLYIMPDLPVNLPMKDSKTDWEQYVMVFNVKVYMRFIFCKRLVDLQQ